MRSKTSDAKLTNLFLDMLAAEQGAGDNTLEAYRGDLADFQGFLAGSGKGFADVETEALRHYLADLDARGLIDRRADRTDHRIQRLHLSAAGGDALATWRSRVLAEEARTFAALTADERDALRHLLVKVWTRD